MTTNVSSEMMKEYCPDWYIGFPKGQCLTRAVNSRRVITRYCSCCCSEMVAFTCYDHLEPSPRLEGSPVLCLNLYIHVRTTIDYQNAAILRELHICTQPLRMLLYGGHYGRFFFFFLRRKIQMQFITLFLENYNLIGKGTLVI